MKILYITTIGGTMCFFTSFIRQLLDEGNTVDIAANETTGSEVQACYRDWGCSVFPLSCTRSPFNLKAILKAIREIRSLVREKRYDIVHCHTPIAAMCTRIACCPLRKKLGLRVFYTAHGFHFFTGAPIKNWLLYYPVEWICSWWTDVLITINKEDYKRASTHLHAKKTVYIPGVGVDTEKFAVCKVDKRAKRSELGLKDTDFVLLSVGELSERKNQKVIIDALGQMKKSDELGGVVYLAVGEGHLQEEFEKLITGYRLEDHVYLLGYRSDIDELCEIADCFVHPSIREGLGIAPLEAMATGLPLISSYVNGIKDYTEDGVSGCCIDPTSINAVDTMIAAIKKMHGDQPFRESCGANNLKTVKEFDLTKSIKVMSTVYNDIQNEIQGGGGYEHLKTILIRQEMRKGLGLAFNDFVIISVGELSIRKNHKVIIEALNKINNKKIYYLIVGDGVLKDQLSNIDKTGRLKLLGYRSDIVNLLHASDLFVFPSIQEGLPVALMEAMATGIPCIASKIRGNVDLLEKENLVNDDWGSIINNKVQTQQITSNCQSTAVIWDLRAINEKMEKLYRQM